MKLGSSLLALLHLEAPREPRQPLEHAAELLSRSLYAAPVAILDGNSIEVCIQISIELLLNSQIW